MYYYTRVKIQWNRIKSIVSVPAQELMLAYQGLLISCQYYEARELMIFTCISVNKDFLLTQFLLRSSPCSIMLSFSSENTFSVRCYLPKSKVAVVTGAVLLPHAVMCCRVKWCWYPGTLSSRLTSVDSTSGGRTVS